MVIWFVEDLLSRAWVPISSPKSLSLRWYFLPHTIRKVKFLSKNSILTKSQHFHEFFTQFFGQFFSWNQSCQQLKSPKPQHFHEFFTQIIFWTIFLVKSKLSTAKKSKTTTFSRVFHPKNRQFSREIKVEFLDKNWRFRTVWIGINLRSSWHVLHLLDMKYHREIKKYNFSRILM